MMEAFGRQKRLPFSPCAKSIAAAPKAWPTQMVWTGGLMYFMQSAIAKASVSKPTAWPWALTVPGELM